jgi:hypothetical protein
MAAGYRDLFKGRKCPANPSFHPACYGWLSQPAHAGELKR